MALPSVYGRKSLFWRSLAGGGTDYGTSALLRLFRMADSVSHILVCWAALLGISGLFGVLADLQIIDGLNNGSY